MLCLLPLEALSLHSNVQEADRDCGQSPYSRHGNRNDDLGLARGIGREYSLEGMLEGFTQRKSVTINLAN